MNGFFRFMASAAGRIIRIVAGIGLIAWGLVGMGGDNGYILAAVGVVPLLTGTVDICLFAPLLGKPLKGSVARAENG
jgi:hypothetical protein